VAVFLTKAALLSRYEADRLSRLGDAAPTPIKFRKLEMV
jgi:hypothetical protein